MDGQEPVIAVPAYVPGPQWVCKNCGTFNADGTTHCSECGFKHGYDPDTQEAITHATVPPQLIAAETAAPSRVALYVATGQLVLTLALLALLAPLLLHMYQNWPFQSPYEQRALALGTSLLTLQSRIDIGTTKAEYDVLLSPLLGDEAAFKAMFSARPEHTRDSYQKLVQAAEYYGLADTAWDAQLAPANLAPSVKALAESGNADKNVKSYWDRAKQNALSALREL